MIKDYYDLMIMELRYLERTLNTPFYNSIAEQAAKVVNSAFNSVVESEGKQITATFDLEALATYVRSLDCDMRFSITDVRLLNNAQWYNLNDFNEMDRLECDEVLEAMYRIIGEVNMYRVHKKLPIVGVMNKKTIVV